jgi:hypothetical protein
VLLMVSLLAAHQAIGPPTVLRSLLVSWALPLGMGCHSVRRVYAHSALHAKRSQLALTAYGMEHYLLSPGPRDSLIDANKEGVCTCAGPPAGP